MANAFENRLTRRRFLQQSTALAALGVGTTLTPDLIYAESKADLKGVTIDYWNMIGVQNKIVREQSEAIVKAFEQKTGCKVNVTWNSYGDIIGPKYRTNFLGGVKPTVFDAASRWIGQLRRFLRPFDDFVANELDASTRDAIAWMFPLFERENRGFKDAKTQYSMPLNLVMQAPYILNRDHWDKAGIDFDKNYPIRDSDHYIELCKEIKAKAGIPYPTEVYGKIWDFADTQLNGWIRSVDKATSDFLNDDWTKSNATSDAWLKGVQFYVDIFRKYDLSSPNTPQSTDEQAVDQFIAGQKSIVHCDLLNRGTLLTKLPDAVNSGRVVWGPQFPLAGHHSGSQCFLAINTFHIVKQDGPDAALKERAAWEFIKEWLAADNALAVSRSSGLSGRRDVWEQLKGEADRSTDAAIATIGDDPGVWNNHPRSVDFQYNLIAPHGQKMLQGAPVADELAAYAKEVDAALREG
ncbi:MAG: ABC transporter substrate-binding protein [Gammaproteobacteria bacterium]